MKKPSLIKRFFSFLLRLCVVLVLMAAIAVGSFEGVTYYLTGSFTSVKKAVKEETDQSGTEDSTEATTVDNKNMENTLVFVHDDMNNKDYNLKGIISEYAFINDIWLKKDENIDDFKLTKIEKDFVVLENENKKIVLELSHEYNP